MNLVEDTIRRNLEKKSICLMTHMIAGYPSLDDNLRALEVMAENDVDLVEMQLPFSEPTADGPGGRGDQVVPPTTHRRIVPGDRDL